MVTDPPPRVATKRRQFEASDALLRLPLPNGPGLQTAARAVGDAMAIGEKGQVRAASEHVLDLLSRYYEVPAPSLQVLGVRPHRVSEGHLIYELFGDYSPQDQRIRVWMRTARLGRVTSFRGLLSTLLHEYCHHLDVCKLGFPATPHTRGFFHRIDELYHLALATPGEQRRPLVWIAQGNSWRIDWRRLRS